MFQSPTFLPEKIITGRVGSFESFALFWFCCLFFFYLRFAYISSSPHLTRNLAAANMERKLHPSTLTGDSENPWDFVLKTDRVCNHWLHINIKHQHFRKSLKHFCPHLFLISYPYK